MSMPKPEQAETTCPRAGPYVRERHELAKH